MTGSSDRLRAISDAFAEIIDHIRTLLDLAPHPFPHPGSIHATITASGETEIDLVDFLDLSRSHHDRLAQVATMADIRREAGPRLMAAMRAAFGHRKISLFIPVCLDREAIRLWLDGLPVLNCSPSTFGSHLRILLQYFPERKSPGDLFALHLGRRPAPKPIRMKASALSRRYCPLQRWILLENSPFSGVIASSLEDAIRQAHVSDTPLSHRRKLPKARRPDGAARCVRVPGTLRQIHQIAGDIHDDRDARAIFERLGQLCDGLPAFPAIFDIAASSKGQVSVENANIPVMLAEPDRMHFDGISATLSERVTAIIRDVAALLPGREIAVAAEVCHDRVLRFALLADHYRIRDANHLRILQALPVETDRQAPFFVAPSGDHSGPALILARSPQEALVQYLCLLDPGTKTIDAIMNCKDLEVYRAEVFSYDEIAKATEAIDFLDAPEPCHAV